MSDLGSIDIDALERAKADILFSERFNAHLFCFALLAATIFLLSDARFVASDLWSYVSGTSESDAPHYYYFGRSPTYLMNQFFIPELFLALTLCLALFNARATSQLNTSRRRIGTAGAAVLLTAMIGFFILFFLADSGRSARLFLMAQGFFSISFANWFSVAELAMSAAAPTLLYPGTSFRPLLQLTERDALVLRDNPDKGFRDRLLRTMLGVPRVVDYLPNHKPRVAVMFIVGNAFYAVSFFFPFVALLVVLMHWIDAYETCTAAAEGCLIAKAQYYFGLSLASALTALFVAPLAAAALTGLAQRHVRISLADLLQRDERAPILFLRPFADDQVLLRSARVFFIARVGRWLATWKSLDALLLDEATPYGPVVAIGNPNDKLPPYGAARGFFSDESWQGAVLEIAERARAIIICVDDFEGVWWEVRSVVARHMGKTLILVHPRYIGDHASGRAIIERIGHEISVDRRNAGFAAAFASQVSADARASVVGGFVGSDGAARIALSGTYSQLAYLLVVRSFLRSRWGLAERPNALVRSA